MGCKSKMIGIHKNIAIVSWNANTMSNKINELKNLIVELKHPEIVCLQSTKFKNNKKLHIPGYIEIRQVDNNNSLGLSIIIREDIKYKELSDLTFKALQTQSLEIFVQQKSFILINTYFRPWLGYKRAEIEKLFDNKNCIWVGDFNASSPQWCTTGYNTAGKLIEEVTLEHGHMIMNTGEPTRIGYLNQRDTAIDLCIISRDFSHPIIEWTTHNDSLGSDHLPCITKIIGIEQHRMDEKSTLNLNINKIKWDKFRDILKNSQIDEQSTTDAYAKKITNELITAAKWSIPDNKKHKPLLTPKLKRTYWWNDKCAEAVTDRKKALQLYRTKRDQDSLNRYKTTRNKATALIRRTKQNSWDLFVQNMTIETKQRQVWGQINSLRGTKKPIDKSSPIEYENKIAITDTDKAEMLGKYFQNISSNNNHNAKFLKHKTNYENINKNLFQKQKLSEVEEYYNKPFNIKELESAIESKKNSSPGEDGISYEMIKQAPLSFKNQILNMFNKIWLTGEVPKCFKEAIIVAIPKEGKSKQLVSSYRPISLTSHLGKTLETIINNRLVYHLESKNLISNSQAGFRKGRQTIDQIVLLDNDVSSAKKQKKAVGAVFIDLKKAYDTMWKGAVLKNLNEMDIRGNMFNYILSFGQDREFKVKVGNAMSSTKIQENGTPQGSVISPTLFNIAINNLSKKIKDPNITISQYADDCAIWKTWGKGKLNVLARQLGKETDNIIQYLEKLGLKCNTTKTKAILFNKKTEITIPTKNNNIITSSEATFLGVIFDKNLTYKKHILNNSMKAYRSLNLMQAVSFGNTKASFKTRKVIYKNLIEAQLGYGQEVYDQGSKLGLKKLDKIQASSLRIMTNSRRNTAITAMQVATGIEPLDLRRKKMKAKYWARVTYNINNPTRNIFGSKNKQNIRGEKISSLVISTKETVNKLNLKNSKKAKKSKIAPWLKTLPITDPYLSTEINKKDCNELISKQKALEHIDNRYNKHIKIYTDGSKKDDRVSIGINCDQLNINHSLRISDACSITTAELKAIEVAVLELKKRCPLNKNTVILTDSLSAIESINSNKNKNSRTDITENIATDIKEIQTAFNTTVEICWIPAHCGIPGNEKADQLAKSGLTNNIDLVTGLGLSDIYAKIEKLIKQQWQQRWDGNKGKLTHTLMPTVGKKEKLSFKAEQKAVTALRLNGTMYKGMKKQCPYCGIELNTKHIILECAATGHYREKIRTALKGDRTPLTIETILNPCAPTTVQTILNSITKAFKGHI